MLKDEILYHYTSITGLNGIINSRNVWASDCRYLNDRKELHHAIELFLRRFDESKKEILSLALHWHNSSRVHCVFSLSKSPKILSQWRTYGDNGCGAAIGFYRRHLPRFSGNPSCVLVDCIYDGHESFLDSLVKQCDEEVQALLNMYAEAKGAVNSFWGLIDARPEHLVRIYGELLKIKNPAFKEEQEVRLIISAPVNQVKTRVVNGLIVPYVEHEFVEKEERHLWCVAPKIWLGPRCDMRNMQALQVFGQFGWGVDGLHHYDCGYI